VSRLIPGVPTTPPLALTARQRLAAYWGVGVMQCRTQLLYRGDLLFRLFGVLLQVYLLSLVWEAAYPASGTAAGHNGHRIALSTQIAYVTFAVVQNWLLNSGGMNFIPHRVREGSVAVDLIRPMRFPTQMLWVHAGATAAQTPFALVALPFAVLAGGAQAPASAVAGVCYAVSLALAVVIALLINTLVSMVAFWTTESTGIFVMYRFVQQFLSGSLVPLWFMPNWLRVLAEWMPFQTTTYAPLAVYLGQARAAPVIGLQMVWCVALFGVLRAVWARALNRVVVQGG
jgi:ABC-type uncharacterized transport system permease subunit